MDSYTSMQGCSLDLDDVSVSRRNFKRLGLVENVGDLGLILVSVSSGT